MPVCSSGTTGRRMSYRTSSCACGSAATTCATTARCRATCSRSVYHASLNALKKGANATAYRSWVAQQIEQSCYAHYDPDDSEVIRKLYSQEIAGQIDAAVESLSPKCREVFRMSHIEGLSNREISERLGITLSTVENHIYNALKQLRQKLSHYKMLILLTMYILGR